MRDLTSSLGFRLTAASYVVVAVFMTVAGFTVYRVSKDSIKKSAMTMVNQMAEDLEVAVGEDQGAEALGEYLLRFKVLKSGSTWIMDRQGNMLYNPDPYFRKAYIVEGKSFGNVTVKLQHASPRASGQGSFIEKLVDIAAKYDEGFGTYRQFGEERILAFRSLPTRGLLIGVDEPVTSANSELDRLKTYIFYTALVSALLIMAFNLLSIRVIIRPFYQELEDLNESLRHSNSQLELINAQLADSNRNLTTLYEVGLGMRHTLALRDILELIVSSAHGVLNVDRIAVFLPSRDGGHLELRAAVGETGGEGVRVPLSGQGGALALAFQRKEQVRVEEGQRIPPSLRLAEPWSKTPALRSRAFVVVPLVSKDRAVGVIAVDNKSRHLPIDESQIALLGIFANQAAVAVDNARLYEQLRAKIQELDARVDQLSILHQISNSMQRDITRGEALGFIMRAIFEAVGFPEVLLTLVNKEEELLQGEMGIGVGADAVRALRVPLSDEESLLATAAQRKSPVGIVLFSEEGLLESVSRPHAASAYRESVGAPVEGARVAVLAVPLIAREEVVGVVAVARREPEPLVKRYEVELLLLYANTAGLTVERAELYGRLRENVESLEVTDHVSGLFTYRYGQQRIAEEIAKSVASKAAFGALLIGIDLFKEYNDRFGHEAGDGALGDIGAILREVLRPGDVAFRYGGRLLGVGLPGAGIDLALKLAGEVQARLAKHRFAGGAGARDQVITASIGAVGFEAGADLPDEDGLFKELLGLLHRAEAAGGNQTLAPQS